MRARQCREGWILVETLVALGLLSVSMIAVHNISRQAIETRGQAEDYTTARFLLENLITDFELQPELVESEGEGTFEAPNERFSYTWKISRVDLPPLALPNQMRPDQRNRLLNLYQDYMGRITATVTWTRAGQDFDIEAETLVLPDQLWQPPPPEEGG